MRGGCGRARARAEAPSQGLIFGEPVVVYYPCTDDVVSVQVASWSWEYLISEGTGQPAKSERAIWFRGSFHGSGARDMAEGCRLRTGQDRGS